MKAKILRSASPVPPNVGYQCGTLISRLSPIVRQDIYDDRQSIADLGETDKYVELVQIWEKPKTGNLKSQKAMPIGCKMP